ncbi:retrotransposon protein, putative, unclassified [Panicum miliaceum]|uniref:Retrotransposon protein, putative, unclassified n=1 Tax=Panicum miliaceum TaxID=4540 RepID=A0A3L6SQ79_PANMI|nr:retrotransposon protein, putative, unclassified [Panicum miliaceum]
MVQANRGVSENQYRRILYCGNRQRRMGYVIGDEEATITYAGAGSCHHLLNALHAELLACVHGLTAAASQGMTCVVLEMDSQLVKLALETDSFALAEIGGVVYELKCLIRSSFGDFRVVFSPRSCNRVAHAVAALDCICSRDTLLYWEELGGYAQ